MRCSSHEMIYKYGEYRKTNMLAEKMSKFLHKRLKLMISDTDTTYCTYLIFSFGQLVTQYTLIYCIPFLFTTGEKG